MTLNTSGALLEGARISTGSNPYTWPPRTVISNTAALDSITQSAEYALFVDGQTTGNTGLDIGDPNLVLLWTRNNGTVQRFDYDQFSRRWNTRPGQSPLILGVFGNSPRLIASVPDSTAPESPYSIYIGTPVRVASFTVSRVENAAAFGSPIAGVVEIAIDSGQLNFGPADLANLSYTGQNVLSTQQGFLDRTKNTGQFGVLPASATDEYFLFLNPIPGVGQTPRIKIGFQAYLNVQIVSTESLITIPSSGTCVISLDTGRIVFSSTDIDDNSSSPVYYDGVILGKTSLTHYSAGISGALSPQAAFIGLTDSFRYIFYTTLSGGRYYFSVSLENSLDGPISNPSDGIITIDVSTGILYQSPNDVSMSIYHTINYIDSYAQIENGVALQLFRSGVNISGYSTVPDFTEKYLVKNQIISTGLSSSPFMVLPTIPLDDSTLAVQITQGTSGGGTYTGPLVDGTDPALSGPGYVFNIANRQLQFVSRKTYTQTLARSTPSIKLPDAAIVAQGVTATINGKNAVPGVDFNFNPVSGLIEFVQSIGEDNTNNILDISGTVILPNTFSTTHPTFSTGNIGMVLYVASGPNVGIYTIEGIRDSKNIVLSTNFVSGGPVIADVRAEYEIVADRFFLPFNPPIRKIIIYKAPDINSVFATLTSNDFTAISTSGQINLTTPAKPGEVYKISYVWLQSPDNGVTVTPTNITELAQFKIRQETAVATVGSPTISFNPNNYPLSTITPPKLYLDGVTLASNQFVINDNQHITIYQPLASTDSVVLDYWVTVATGGQTSFTLANNPVDIDYPQIIGLDTVSGNEALAPSVFNGNQTSVLKNGGAMLVNKIDVLLINTVTYDSTTDITSVTFLPEPEISTSTTSAAILSSSAPINGSYLVKETLPVDIVSKGTTTVSISGNASGYKSGTVILLNGDPYLVSAASYNSTNNITTITLADNTTNNYIISSVHRTIRPILSSGTTFTTALALHSGFPIILVDTGTNNPRTLVSGVDYIVSDGGTIKLNASIGFGDALSIFYVARVSQPAGTQVSVNYAYAIAPDTNNGLLGQVLALTYDLYSPDTFYYHTYTIPDFIPVVVQELQASASTGGSGPNIQSKSSPQNKDMGTTSLYYNEQHIANDDVVISRLLQFYNDLANSYEDILSDLDGRVVGGTSGRFLFDGNLNNPPRLSYSQVTNDIDDKIQVATLVELTGFFVFSDVPVYDDMWHANSYSRIYPTTQFVTAALNGNVGNGNNGKLLGSIPVNNLNGIGIFTSSPSIAVFTTPASTGPYGTGSLPLSINQNGNTKLLVPQLAAGYTYTIYAPDGTPDVSGTITSVTGLNIVINIPTTLSTGSIVALPPASSANPYVPGTQHSYIPGKDFNVAPNGQIYNSTLPSLIAGLIGQLNIVGNELVSSTVQFSNSLTTPLRIPVLDGSTLTDAGNYSNPPLFRRSETSLLSDEAYALSHTGSAQINPDSITLVGLSIPLIVGQTFSFTTGPNVGVLLTVATRISTTSVTVNPAGLVPDALGSMFTVTNYVGSPFIIENELLGILGTNTSSAPIPPALIGHINSELITIDSIIRSFGPQTLSSTGVVSGTTLTDSSVNYADLITKIIPNITLLYVTSGTSQGLYLVTAVTDTTLTVSTTSPYFAFPTSTSAPYLIIQPWSFVSNKEPQFCVSFLQQTLAFYQSTQAWVSSPSSGGLSARIANVVARQSYIVSAINSISALLGKGDNLYNQRYLWIQQRTDMSSGTLYNIEQAQNQRISNTNKLYANQQKLLVASNL